MFSLSPIFLAQLTPNQRVKTPLLSGACWVEELSMPFPILAGRGVKAQTGPQGLALSCPEEVVMAQGAVNLSTEKPRNGKLAVAPQISWFPFGASL